VDALYVCGFWQCGDFHVIQAPPGTGTDMAYKYLSWTPTPAQTNANVPFAISVGPDSCGDSASQSWTVHVLPENVPPTVASVYPAGNATNIPLNGTITATFSEPVKPQSVTTATVLVSGPSGAIAGSVQTSGSTVTFKSSADLPASSPVTVTLTTGIKDLAGNAMASNYAWTFTTGATADTTPPSVPANVTATRVSGSEIVLSWTASTDDFAVAGYKVYRDGPLIDTVTNLASLTYSDAGLNFNTRYCYTVSAYDSVGNESTQSTPPVCETTLDFVAGTVASWGGVVRSNNTYGGQTPPDVVPGIINVESISIGSSQRLALKSNHTAWLWGLVPTQVPNLTNLTATGGANFVIQSGGTVWGWGNNEEGQLGTGTTTDATVPVQMLNVTQAIAVAAGAYHTLVLKSDGTVWATGQDGCGELGDGSAISQNSVVQVLGLTNVIAIAAATDHSLALKSDGTVWAWGGCGLSTYYPYVTQIAGLSDVTAIAQGGNFALAVKADKTAWAWGSFGSHFGNTDFSNQYGQLGNGTYTGSQAPVRVKNLTNVVAVAAGDAHSMALKSDGTVWAWGRNGLGQLGDGTTTNRNLAVQVLKLTQVKAIAASGDSSSALK
jgi:hypothetical protein